MATKGGDTIFFDEQAIAALLIRIRSARNFSQAAVARNLFSQSMLSRVETADACPSFTKMLMLLYRLNIPLAEFEALLLHSIPHHSQHTHYNIYLLLYNLDIRLLISDLKNAHPVHPVKSYPYISSLCLWLECCFAIHIAYKKENMNYMEQLLNQDEFFYNDFYPLIFGLTYLKSGNIVYIYNRICSHLKNQHQLKDISHLLIDATITIGCVYYNTHDFSMSHYYFLLALQQCKAYHHLLRTMIVLLILYFSTKNQLFLSQAEQIKTIFSQDISYHPEFDTLRR